MLLLGKSAEAGTWGWWPDGAEGAQRDADRTGGWVRASRAHKAQRGVQLAPWTEEGAGGLNTLYKLCRTADHPGLVEVASCTRLPPLPPSEIGPRGPSHGIEKSVDGNQIPPGELENVHVSSRSCELRRQH